MMTFLFCILQGWFCIPDDNRPFHLHTKIEMVLVVHWFLILMPIVQRKHKLPVGGSTIKLLLFFCYLLCTMGYPQCSPHFIEEEVEAYVGKYICQR